MLTADEIQEIRNQWAPSHEDIDRLCDHIAAQGDALAELRSEVREWICRKCKWVYPGPPQQGVKCVVCLKCGGDTMPKSVAERMDAEEQLRQVQAEGAQLRTALARWVDGEQTCPGLVRAGCGHLVGWPDNEPPPAMCIECETEQTLSSTPAITAYAERVARMEEALRALLVCEAERVQRSDKAAILPDEMPQVSPDRQLYEAAVRLAALAEGDG